MYVSMMPYLLSLSPLRSRLPSCFFALMYVYVYFIECGFIRVHMFD